MRGDLIALWLCLPAAACSEPYAWEQSSAQPPVAARPASRSAAPLPEGGPLAPSPGGALYARCSEGFTPSTEPLRDVTRLSLACGPSTGMVRVGTTTFEGTVAADGAAVVIPFPIELSRCYRVFAVADPQVEDLALELLSSRGTPLASDHGVGRVAMIHGDQPFCALADDEAVLRVSSPSGRGQFALEVYALGAPKRLPGASSVDGPPPQR